MKQSRTSSADWLLRLPNSLNSPARLNCLFDFTNRFTSTHKPVPFSAPWTFFNVVTSLLVMVHINSKYLYLLVGSNQFSVEKDFFSSFAANRRLWRFFRGFPLIPVIHTSPGDIPWYNWFCATMCYNMECSCYWFGYNTNVKNFLHIVITRSVVKVIVITRDVTDVLRITIKLGRLID